MKTSLFNILSPVFPGRTPPSMHTYRRNWTNDDDDYRADGAVRRSAYREDAHGAVSGFGLRCRSRRHDEGPYARGMSVRPGSFDGPLRRHGRPGPQPPHQLQFALEIDVMRQLDMLQEPRRLDVVAMHQDEFLVLRGRALILLAQLLPAQRAIHQRHGDGLALGLAKDQSIATGELRRLGF